MRLPMAWLSIAVLGYLSGCEKPCPMGQQRYGVKCVDSPDASVGAAHADEGQDASDTACTSDGRLLYRDQDGDGYGKGAALGSCSGTSLASVAGDCDDGSSAVYPQAEERCNGIDDDCDDKTDESLGDACDAVACADLGCGAKSECVLEGARLRCKCIVGFEGDGKTCTNIDDCAASPCKNGGTCEDGLESYACKCTADTTGDNCELEICGSILIRTKAEMDASRLCAEIQGDLSIDPAGLSTFDQTDLPNLRKVTGHLSIIAGFNTPVAVPALTSITLSALETVGGSLSLGPNSVQEIHLPSLRTVGVGTDPSMNALTLMQLSAKVVSFPKLETIGGKVELNSLQQLCSANFRKVSKVAGDARVYMVPKLPVAQIQPILSAAQSTSFQWFSCCIYQAGTADCEGGWDPFSPECRCSN